MRSVISSKVFKIIQQSTVIIDMEKKSLLIIIFTFVICVSCTSWHKKHHREKEQQTSLTCPSAKEYVTTYNYLRSQQEALGLSMEETQNISQQVSKGCTGAAPRFIKSFEVLNKVGLGGRSALMTGINLAQHSEEHAEAFIIIFKKAYLQKYLDLDMRTAYKLASELSIQFNGKPMKALNDFDKLTKFCMHNKYSQLPIPICASVAASIIKKGEFYNKNLANDFMTVFMYLRKDSSLQLDIQKALQMAETIVTSGPEAGENFRIAYEFGISQKGLNFTAQQALDFAQTMIKTAHEQNEKRWPASRVK